jgi:hypothetical protein
MRRSTAADCRQLVLPRLEIRPMKYLMFIKHKELDRPQTPPPALMKAMGEFVGRMFDSGALKETGGLKPPKQSVYLRSSGGRLQVLDGPFSEAKEIVGGYAIVDVKTREEALAVAREFMQLHVEHWPEFECESEMREIEGV